MKRTALIALALIAAASPAEAGGFRRAARQSCTGGTCPTAGYGYTYSYQYAYAATTVQPTQQQQVAVQQVSYAATTQTAQGDAYGFTAWLNGVRAQHGLGAVGCDANLCSWAAQNNNHQAAYGMGHHVMGPARRQNSGMGASTTVFQMWLASPAHRAALLDPSISWIGIAAGGAYWTFNAY